MSPEPEHEKPPAERRRNPRRRVFKSGVVAFNDRFSSLPCIVRDISATGARLRIEGSLNAPDHFELLVAMDGLEAQCEVVSRKSNELAVRFLAPPRYGTPSRVQVVKALVPDAPPTLRRKPKPTAG